MSNDMTRRTFIGTAAPAAIGAGLLGSRIWAADAPPARGANETINIGLIGCGGRGGYLMEMFRSLPNVNSVAVCDVHLGRAGKVQQALGGKPKVYQDYRKVVGNKEIDAVIVATTDHWHVLPAIEACAAGKDVYLEKPVGTSIAEGRAAVKAARKYNRIVHMGTMQHSWEHYRQAVEIIRSGILGNISNVEVFDLESFYPGFGAPPDGTAPPELDWEFYVGPSPAVPFNQNRYDRFYWFPDYGGGWQVDWAVHHYDIVHWAMDVTAPVAAIGHGGKFAFPKDNTQWPDTFIGACEYPSGPVAKSGFLLSYIFRGGCNHPIEKKYHGKVFYGTDGVLALDRGGYVIYSQSREGRKVIQERQGSSIPEDDAVKTHVKAFLACVRTRKPSVTDVEMGHLASNPGHLMNIAYRVGRRVRWDSVAEQIPDDPQADALVAKRYRAPWSLPA
jgi:predicted dehydrogenase